MKNAKKGFTLVEMLIVVAIIAILVAITIPVLNGQLERAREAADAANLRAAYAEAAVNALTTGGDGASSEVTITQTTPWDSDIKIGNVSAKSDAVLTSITKNDKVVVKVNASGVVSFEKK